MPNEPLGNQKSAVTSQADRVLVIAPPGCGKTEVLAMRAGHLIRTGVVRPQRKLLALTFTNRAKDNLGARLRRQLGDSQVRRSVSVMNFHELGARIVEAHSRSIGLEQGYSFPNASWLRKTMDSFTVDWKSRKEAVDLLSRLKRETIGDAELWERLRQSGNALAIGVEDRRRSENYVDYGDVLRYAALILQNDRISTLFREHFDALIVDEFQDLSVQQFAIAEAVCGKNTTYVGDPYQGIFGWAGAQPTHVHNALRTSAAETIDLDVSFRSSPAVLEVVNAVSRGLGAGVLTAARPGDWKNGGHAHAVTFETDDDEASGIVALTDRLAAAFPGDRIGVICRAEYRRGALERAYKSAAVRPQYWDIALDASKVVRLLKQHVRHVDESNPFDAQVSELSARVCASIRPTDIDTIAEIRSACDQLLDIGRSEETVSQLMGRIRDTQDQSPVQVGVHVLNAHVGKGQQFDWVVVMGLEEGHVPSTYSTTAAQVQEELRVLLVMLSRARKGMFLTHARATHNKYGRVFRQGPSRWWDAIATACQPLPASIQRIMYRQP